MTGYEAEIGALRLMARAAGAVYRRLKPQPASAEEAFGIMVGLDVRLDRLRDEVESSDTERWFILKNRSSEVIGRVRAHSHNDAVRISTQADVFFVKHGRLVWRDLGVRCGMVTSNQTIHEWLIEARNLLADEKRWTQGAEARNETGGLVRAASASAACWCSDGAMIKVAGSSAQELRYVFYDMVGCDFITGFNDTHTHPQVLELWDRVIAEHARRNDGVIHPGEMR